MVGEMTVHAIDLRLKSQTTTRSMHKMALLTSRSSLLIYYGYIAVVLVLDVTGLPLHASNHYEIVYGTPQRTEALINNTMVASGMLYRFFRAIWRAGTIVYSYAPLLPNPFG